MQISILLLIYLGLLVVYFYLGPLKKVSQQSQLDFAMDADEPDDILSQEETTFVNKASSIIYLSLGLIIWIYLGITVGKLSRLICNYVSFDWLIHFILYFILLRMPFGIINKSIEKTYDIDTNFQKIGFAVVMIASFILTIMFYDWLPYFLQWP